MQPTQPIHPKLFVALTHAVGAGTIALTVAAVYWLSYQPLHNKQEDYLHRTTQLRGLLDNSIEVRRAHVQLQKQLDELSSRVQRSQQATPRKARESEFLAEATRVASDNGLEIDDYRRGRARHLATHSELEITLSALGSHESICRFLAAMEAMPRAKQITRLSIQSEGGVGAYPFEVAYTLYFGLKTPNAATLAGGRP